MHTLFLILSTFVWVVKCTHLSYTIEEYAALSSALLDNYSSKIRPIWEQGQSLNMEVSLWISAINDVSDVDQKMITTGYLYVKWKDEMITWDSTTTGIYWMQFNQKDLWMPDLVLKNGFTAFKPLGGDFYFVFVDFDGTVSWYPYAVFESKCDIDVTYYPFDRQTCNIVFKTWSYSRSEINLTVSEEMVGFYEFVPNSVWEVTSTDATYDMSYSEADITFIINLRRKPFYYIINLFLPITFLGILSPVVFIIPADAGEKMGYAVTIFLTFVVFLTIVNGQLPVNSESVSNMSIYLIIKLLFGALIIFITSLQLRLHHRKSDREIGKVFRCMVRIERRLRCLNKNSIDIAGTESKDTEIKEIGPSIEWIDVSSAIDFYSFWVLLLADIVISAVLFTYSAMH
ncbi:neuronal acetylcholine receptor subunit alpha-6-like [Ostrea edulis]|uniref:neuronal acetylcholine receptor subunit alpha-6-like n=1 Tax=Ostrea edulis TaxID=37623 RepID=UPI0024AFDB0A|nr:neuronal acetylcholine receptor subunit alpha-6-like [Ostrea edulis]